MSEIYNQKKHERDIAAHPLHLSNGFYDMRKFDFLHPYAWVDYAVDDASTDDNSTEEELIEEGASVE